MRQKTAKKLQHDYLMNLRVWGLSFISIVIALSGCKQGFKVSGDTALDLASESSKEDAPPIPPSPVILPPPPGGVAPIPRPPVPPPTPLDPPVGSALALNSRPRIFFKASDIPQLRSRVSTYYRNEYQNLLNTLANPDFTPEGVRNWAPVNYAFAAILGTAEMGAEGFKFPAGLDTPYELCQEAYKSIEILLPDVPAGKSQAHHVMTGRSSPLYVPILTAYDWCYSNFLPEQRKAIIDAFVANYQTKYQGKDLMKLKILGGNNPMVAYNMASAWTHDIVGIVALYGDPQMNAALMAEMYTAFAIFWFDRVLGEVNNLYPYASMVHEGAGGYMEEVILNLAFPLLAFSSAMGQDYFMQTPLFSKFHRLMLSTVRPHSLSSLCGPQKNERCPDFLERWADTGTAATITCLPLALTSGVLRRANHPEKGLARWIHSSLPKKACEDEIGSNPWHNSVVYQFIFGDREIAPQSASDLNLSTAWKNGLEQYVFKSNWTASATQVVFYGDNFSTYGHARSTYGTFGIFKYGDLIPSGYGNYKAGDARLESPVVNQSNVILLHKDETDPHLAFGGEGLPHPYFSSKGDMVRVIGSTQAESIGNSAYDYVSYDNTGKYVQKRVSLSQREFLYIHGVDDHEYVVLFDRLNVVNPDTDEKIFKINLATQPVYVNGNATNPREGKWTSTNTTVISLTNEMSNVKTPFYESADTHGRLFLKVLFPQSVEIKTLGGAGHEYESGNDDGTILAVPKSPHTDATRSYLGWGRLEIHPRVRANYDIFLNVMQIGDSHTLNSMADTELVQSTVGGYMGVHIKDPVNPWIAMFSMGELFTATAIKYAYNRSGAIKHVIFNLKKSTTYYYLAQANTVEIRSTNFPGATASNSDSSGALNLSL